VITFGAVEFALGAALRSPVATGAAIAPAIAPPAVHHHFSFDSREKK